jgi:alkylation response protein AidB-like acyl-CoA dehydrogenase
MDFDFSPDQHHLKEELQRFMASEAPLSVAREVLEGDQSYDAALWSKIVDMGISRLCLDEAHGGFGLGIIEQCIAAQEMGRQLAPVPSISSLYLAQQLLLMLPASALRDQQLQHIGEGRITAVAIPMQSPWATSLTCHESAISGEQHFVLNGVEAEDVIVFSQRDDGTSVMGLCHLKNGITSQRQALIDNSMSAAHLVFDRAPCKVLLEGQGCEDILSQTLDRAACLLSFEQLGACESAFAMANEYAKERYTFGRPIGSYQAIKHKLVDLHSSLQLAYVHCLYAAWALDTDDASLPAAAASALLSTQDAFTTIATENIHIHGGMGYTWEMDCHMYFKRARFYASVLGNKHLWHERLGAQLLKRENEV